MKMTILELKKSCGWVSSLTERQCEELRAYLLCEIFGMDCENLSDEQIVNEMIRQLKAEMEI